MWETDHVDAGDGLSELRAANSLKDLHRLLVTRQVSGRSTQHQEAVELFVHHHGEDSAGAVDTALLLCTEPRWQRCTAKLIAGICDAGILDDLALDELAGRLLWTRLRPVRENFLHRKAENRYADAVTEGRCCSASVLRTP